MLWAAVGVDFWCFGQDGDGSGIVGNPLYELLVLLFNHHAHVLAVFKDVPEVAVEPGIRERVSGLLQNGHDPQVLEILLCEVDVAVIVDAGKRWQLRFGRDAVVGVDSQLALRVFE